MSCDINRLDPGKLIADNDPRMDGRKLSIIGFEAGKISAHERATLSVCTNIHDRSSRPREHRINVRRIHTDGKPRKSGYSLVERDRP